VVLAFVVISCSATDAPERSNETPAIGKRESVDKLGDVHLNQAVIQAPPSSEGAHSWVCFGGVQYLMEDMRM